jgi:hypothetical protein
VAEAQATFGWLQILKRAFGTNFVEVGSRLIPHAMALLVGAIKSMYQVPRGGDSSSQKRVEIFQRIAEDGQTQGTDF